jgi:hypothetical protein
MVTSMEKAVVFLYDGADDEHAPSNHFLAELSDYKDKVLALDKVRNRAIDNILEDYNYGWLVVSAALRKMDFVGGGPNCKTWSSYCLR